MKKRKTTKRLLAALLLTVSMLAAALSVQTVQAASKARVHLNPGKLTIYQNGKTRLTLTGTTKSIKWSSSDKAVATIDSKGWLTATGGGDCIITAKYGNSEEICAVTVIGDKSKPSIYDDQNPPPQDGKGPKPADKVLKPETSTLYIEEVGVGAICAVPERNMIVVELENTNPLPVRTVVTINYTDKSGASQTINPRVMLIGGGRKLYFEVEANVAAGSVLTAATSGTVTVKNNFAQEAHNIEMTPVANKDSSVMSFRLKNKSNVDLDYLQYGVMFYNKGYAKAVGYDSFSLTNLKAGESTIVTVRKATGYVSGYYRANVNYAYAGLPD